MWAWRLLCACSLSGVRCATDMRPPRGGTSGRPLGLLRASAQSAIVPTSGAPTVGRPLASTMAVRCASGRGHAGSGGRAACALAGSEQFARSPRVGTTRCHVCTARRVEHTCSYTHGGQLYQSPRGRDHRLPAEVLSSARRRRGSTRRRWPARGCPMPRSPLLTRAWAAAPRCRGEITTPTIVARPCQGDAGTSGCVDDVRGQSTNHGCPFSGSETSTEMAAAPVRPGGRPTRSFYGCAPNVLPVDDDAHVLEPAHPATARFAGCGPAPAA